MIYTLCVCMHACVHVCVCVCVCDLTYHNINGCFSFVTKDLCPHNTKQICVNVKDFAFYQWWGTVCITFKIQILHFTLKSCEGLTALNSEHGLILGMLLMNMEWKYSLKKHQEGGESTPMKHRKLEARIVLAFIIVSHGWWDITVFKKLSMSQ